MATNQTESLKFSTLRAQWLEDVENDSGVSHMQFRLAYVLAGYFNSDTGKAWPSQETLANRLGVTRRGIQKALAALAARGHLHIESAEGRTNTNHYSPLKNGEPAFAILFGGDDKTRTPVPEMANAGSWGGEPPFQKQRTAVRTEHSLRTSSNEPPLRYLSIHERGRLKKIFSEEELLLLIGRREPESLSYEEEKILGDAFSQKVRKPSHAA